MFQNNEKRSINNLNLKLTCEFCLKRYDSFQIYASHRSKCKNLKVHVQEIPTLDALPLIFNLPKVVEQPIQMPDPLTEIKTEIFEDTEIKIETEDDINEFCCPICPEMFVDETIFISHFEKHSAEEIFWNQTITTERPNLKQEIEEVIKEEILEDFDNALNRHVILENQEDSIKELSSNDLIEKIKQQEKVTAYSRKRKFVAESSITPLSKATILDLDGKISGDWQPMESVSSSPMNSSITPIHSATKIQKTGMDLSTTKKFNNFQKIFTDDGANETATMALPKKPETVILPYTILPDLTGSIEIEMLPDHSKEDHVVYFCDVCRKLLTTNKEFINHRRNCTNLPRKPLEEPKEETYSKEDLKRASDLIGHGISMSSTAKLLNIPISFLERKFASKVPKPQPELMFSKNDDKEFLEWIVRCSRLGYHRDKDDLLMAAQELWNASDKPCRKLKDDFINNFLLLHQIDLSNIQLSTVECEDEVQLKKFHNHMNDCLQDLLMNDIDLLKDPKRIYNMDSVRFEYNPEVLIKVPKLYLQSNVMFTCSADGTFLNPVVIFPEDRPDFQTIPDFHYQYHKFSNISPKIFEFYISKVFHPSLVAKNVEFPVILLIDDQRLDITWQIFEYCKLLKIILVTLYPRFQQIIQPFEIAVASKVTLFWKRFLDKKFGSRFQIRINQINFATLLKEFSDTFLDEKHVKYGFKISGVFPWDAEAIRYNNLIKRCRERVGDESNTTDTLFYFIGVEDKEKMHDLYSTKSLNINIKA